MAAAEICSYLKLRQEHFVHAICGSLLILERSFAFFAWAWLSKIKLILTLYKGMFPVSDIPNRVIRRDIFPLYKPFHALRQTLGPILSASR
jgi:hypothetical protein